MMTFVCHKYYISGIGRTILLWRGFCRVWSFVSTSSIRWAAWFYPVPWHPDQLSTNLNSWLRGNRALHSVSSRVPTMLGLRYHAANTLPAGVFTERIECALWPAYYAATESTIISTSRFLAPPAGNLPLEHLALCHFLLARAWTDILRWSFVQFLLFSH